MLYIFNFKKLPKTINNNYYTSYNNFLKQSFYEIFKKFI